jgi:hypothetical protein
MGKSSLAGIGTFCSRARTVPIGLTPQRFRRVLFGPAPKPRQIKGDGFVGFLKQTYLFRTLTVETLDSPVSIQTRTYRDGEYISEQGKPGAALFVLRNGVVEITRRKRNGEEFPLATLDPPASFEELAAMGEVVRWTSARARGPVSLVAQGASYPALGGNFPHLANKILMRLVQITAARVQMLVEAQYFSEQDQESKP